MEVLAQVAVESYVWCFGCGASHPVERFVVKHDAPAWICRESAFQDRAYCRRFGDVSSQCDAVVRHFIGDRTYSRDVSWTFVRDLVRQYLMCFSFDELKDTALMLYGDRCIVGVRHVKTGERVLFDKQLQLWGKASKLGIR